MPSFNSNNMLSSYVTIGTTDAQQLLGQHMLLLPQLNVYNDANTGTAVTIESGNPTDGSDQQMSSSSSIYKESPISEFREGLQFKIKQCGSKLSENGKYNADGYAIIATYAIPHFTVRLLLVIINKFKPEQVLQTCNFSPGHISGSCYFFKFICILILQTHMSLSSDGDSLCYYQFDHSKRKSN
jgi:hypothetical protein